MSNPPDLVRCHEILVAEAPTAFAFLRDEGFGPGVAPARSEERRDGWEGPFPSLQVVFATLDRRLIVELRARRSWLYRHAEVYLGRRGDREWSLDEIAADVPPDIVPAPGRGGGWNIDDESDVVPAVQHLAERVRSEWLGFLRADIGVFDRFEQTRERRVRAQIQADSDARRAERGRLAFDAGDYARAVAELDAAHELGRADAKRLDIARRRV